MIKLIFTASGVSSAQLLAKVSLEKPCWFEFWFGNRVNQIGFSAHRLIVSLQIIVCIYIYISVQCFVAFSC